MSSTTGDEKQGIQLDMFTSSNNGAVGHTSQIPGLGNYVDGGPEKKTHGRRTGILESDSDYVKLAKQGGQKGLLWHEEKNLETKSKLHYIPPDWFSSESGPQEIQSTTKRTTPDYMTSEEFKKSPSKASLHPLDAPFGSDSKTHWEREPQDKKAEMNHPVIQLENPSLTTENYKDAGKYKKVSFDKKEPPVSMQKLLSFGYADEWHAVNTEAQKDEEESSVNSEPPSSVAADQDLSQCD
ncbi:uncharacterized protein C7orf57 homolog isoform X2 [Lepisosteus oculatus]|nr:PREDICTED: uncharacterized protein C7orf57 homolog isoform X2 [Lepisosteus oculatus]